jgi:hypothetical protein
VAEVVLAIGLGEAVLAIGEETVWAIVLAEAEPTASEAVTFHAAVAVTAMPLEAVPEDIVDRALVAAAAAAHPVWDLGEAAEGSAAAEAEVVVAGGAGR